MVYKLNKPYINKKGRLILGDGIKKKDQKQNKKVRVWLQY